MSPRVKKVTTSVKRIKKKRAPRVKKVTASDKRIKKKRAPRVKKVKASGKRIQKKRFEQIRLLSTATPAARKELVRKGDRELIDCISECCVNVLNGVVKLNPQQKAQLARHKNKLRALASKKTGIRKKKQTIQKGGFLGALLQPVASFLGNVLFGSQ